MGYRLGLDLGTNSIGWAILNLKNDQPDQVIRCGVRIFPDGRNPKDKTSLAVARREARQQRRRRDRLLKRQQRLMDTLVECGLMPQDPASRLTLEHLDPYEIRHRALREKIPAHHLGRAIFHISKRRGFKSNRKVDRGDGESGKVKTAISKTRAQMSEDGARTYGEWLYQRRQTGKGVLARTTGEGASSEYEIYADRSLIDEEICTLFTKQRELGLEEARENNLQAVRNVVLFQRDLLPVSPGDCTFERGHPRAPLADPRVQRFRIYQELNNLELRDEQYRSRKLSLEERDRLATLLLQRPKLTFDQIRKQLGVNEATQINLDVGTRGYLKGDETGNVLKKPAYFGKAWLQFSVDEQVSICRLLLETESEQTVIETLIQQYGVPVDVATAILSAPLPEGFGRLSIKAIEKILPHLEASVITYAEASAAAGYHHSQLYDGVWHERLPYYGEILQRYTGKAIVGSSHVGEATYGRISNPTVHIALNELRKVINGILEKYGHPEEIVIEVARDLKLGVEKKKEINRLQKENRERNERYAKELEKLGLKNNYDNRLRLRLWEELGDISDRRCPYTGRMISLSMLFSDEVQIEHIIPFTRSLDDGIANKTLSLRKANRDKGNKTPYEAFGDSRNGYNWDDILDRADKLPANKRARFAPDAIEKFASEDKWLARQLTDTSYISRVAREYLTAICPLNMVWTVPGRMTAQLRHTWGLNTILGEDDVKNRSDHRHHAIDAVVVGLTDRKLLHRIQNYTRALKPGSSTKPLESLPPLWVSLRDDVEVAISKVVVSHKPDHGRQGALHNDTAFGIVSGPTHDGTSVVVHRKPITQLKAKDLDKIRDLKLAERIRDYVEQSGEPFEKAVRQFSEEQGVYRCRVIENLAVIPISNGLPAPFKAYKGDSNFCYEIWVGEKGRWDGRIITTFEANTREYQTFASDTERYRSFSFDGYPLVMRLCPNDVVAVDDSGERRRLLRVVKQSSGRISFCDIYEANVDSRNRAKDDSFSYITKAPASLQKLRARRVFIDPLGQLKDPGAFE